MEAWRFSTDSYPPLERATAWRDAMSRLGLPVGELEDRDPPEASVTCLTSPLGIEFALIDADAQTISGRRTDLPAAIWLAVLLSGEATIQDGEDSLSMAIGDIAYGPTGRTATLALHTSCRILFVSAPRVALDHRLVSVRGLQIGRLEAGLGVSGILSGFLRSTADALPDLSADDLRPVELALTELLAASLAVVSENGNGEAGAMSPYLHRICQMIETLLPDADLSLRRLADKAHASPRYIQKLFASAGDTFGHYVRVRRLERCRLDLGSPMRMRLSISEICFRWGFNDSAHFSRAFRNQYGMSPREYRRAAGAQADDVVEPGDPF